jgi:phenylpropionate dioxygenase-like ring-hydroxylating dioxygenase large terminal subunit
VELINGYAPLRSFDKTKLKLVEFPAMSSQRNFAGLNALVNWKEGLISPAIQFDEEVYRLEQERIFGHAWLVVGHEDMVRKPGDYVSNYMGEVPVIVVRDMQGKVRVLVNRCAHRGVEVCLFDRGNTRGFTCPYHGWSYDLTGRLTGVPMDRQVYHGELNKDAWGLEEVPRMANFSGLIFASLDPNAPDFEEWLSEDARWWLQSFVLVPHLGGLEMLPGWHRYRTPGNWKLLAENFIGDDYHVYNATHVSLFKAAREFAQQGVLTPMVTYPADPGEAAYEANAGPACPLGLGIVVVGDTVYNRDLEEAKTLGDDAVEWVIERRARLHEAIKDKPIKPYSFMNGCLFPNLGLMGFMSPMLGRQFLLFQPRGVKEHEVWQWTMVEREAPQAVKELAVQRAYQGQHMAGLIAPDDVENFARLVDAMRTPRMWQRPFHYGMQIAHEEEAPRGLPGKLGPNPSEMNQRQFYRVWLDLMQGR